MFEKVQKYPTANTKIYQDEIRKKSPIEKITSREIFKTANHKNYQLVKNTRCTVLEINTFNEMNLSILG